MALWHCLQSKEVVSKRRSLQITTYSLRDELARILSISRRKLEVHFPVHIDEGLEVSFAIWTIRIRTSYLVSIIEHATESMERHRGSTRFSRMFRDQWRLKQLPEIDGVRCQIRNCYDLAIVPTTPSSSTVPLSPPTFCGFFKKKSSFRTPSSPLMQRRIATNLALSDLHRDETEMECLTLKEDPSRLSTTMTMTMETAIQSQCGDEEDEEDLENDHDAVPPAVDGKEEIEVEVEVENKIQIPRPSTTKDIGIENGVALKQHPHPIIVNESSCASRREPFHGLQRTLSSSAESDRKVAIERVPESVQSSARIQSSPTRTYQRIESLRSVQTETADTIMSTEVGSKPLVLSSPVPVFKSRPYGGLGADGQMESNHTVDTQDSYWSQLKKNESRRYRWARSANPHPHRHRHRMHRETTMEIHSEDTAEDDEMGDPVSPPGNAMTILLSTHSD